MSGVVPESFLRAALDAVTPGGYDPTARSEVYVQDSEAPADTRQEDEPAPRVEPSLYGGGTGITYEPEFDPAEVAGRLASGSVRVDYTPPPVFITPRHRT